MMDRRGFGAMMLAMVLAAGAARAQEIFADNGMALRGYDPVAYFTDGQARAGLADITADWSGVEWRFVSADNRDTFLAAPESYAPQYGGFCAWTMAQGHRAPTNPHAWAVVEGRLYLNSSTRVHRRWARDVPGNIAQADANWSEMGDQRPFRAPLSDA